MNFDEFEKYLIDISKLEFNERNHEIQLSVSRHTEEMSSREIVNSSIALRQLSDFFGSEYIARCEFIKNFIIGYAGILDLTTSKDPVTKAKTFFQQLSTSEKSNLIAVYDSSVSQIVKQLLGSHPKELKESLQQRIDNSIFKNNLYVELKFKALNDAKSSGKEVLVLNPNFYGFGIDLKELWIRHFHI